MKIQDIFESDDLPPQDWVVPSYNKEFDLTPEALGVLREKIGKLNNKAIKLGVPEIQIVELGEKQVPVKSKDSDQFGLTVRKITVKVVGESPKLAGWTFVGTIEHKDGGNVIRTVPGYDNVESLKTFYKARPDYCDQCHKKRNRVDTYIVKSDKNEYKQIGRNCIRDFLGGKDPQAILWFVASLDKLDDVIHDLTKDIEETEGRSGGSYRERYANRDKILAATAAAIRLYGYRKSSNGYQGSTVHMLRAAIFNELPRDRDSIEHQWHRELSAASAADVAKAKQVLSWWDSVPQEDKDNNTFMHNVDVVLNSENVSIRDLGYAAALFPTYARAMDHITSNSTTKSNVYLGKVGDKIPPTAVTVTSCRVISGMYGQTQIVTMKDQTGNTLVWFNNSSSDMEEGQTATIVGTIKKLEEFNGIKQTFITRVKEAKAAGPNPSKPASGPKTQVQQPTTNREGSKVALAAAKFREMSDTGAPPSRSEFIKILTSEPFNMSQAGASTYYAKIKKMMVEGVTFTDFLIMLRQND